MDFLIAGKNRLKQGFSEIINPLIWKLAVEMTLNWFFKR